MSEIPLTKELVTVVDEEDYEYLSQFKWHVISSSDNSTLYAARRLPKPSRKYVFMHNEILNVRRGFTVDHIDRDGLNNTRRNLREATASLNMHNRTKKRNGSSKYKGVCKTRSGKWVAYITKDRNAHYLGIFVYEIDAAIAYDEAAEKLYGKTVCHNKALGLLN